MDKYLDTVETEINLLLKSGKFNDTKLNTVYLGGGTPTCLSVGQLNRIFSLLQSKFTIKTDAEITVEASPETILAKDGKEKLKVLLKNNVNRLSMGFQTFNDDILKVLRRRYNSKQAIEAYKIAKRVGFENINIDLIPGLPDQTLEVWQKDLEKIGKLAPASVTCYPLSIKQTTAIYQLYQKERQRFPNREDVVLMHIMATEFFDKLGYSQKPVYWFTKELKYIYKQQISKWSELGRQLALGVSGYSFINDFQYFNYLTVSEYLEAINKSILPIYKGIKLSKVNLMRRLLVLGLKAGISKKLFISRFGKKPKDVFKDVWKKIKSLGLVEEDNEVIRLSYKGRPFCDEISKEFYSEKIRENLFR